MSFNGKIYRCFNKINGKSYIGQTISKYLTNRISGHYHSARQHLKKNENNKFHNALRKYNKEDFEWTIIESDITTQEELDQKEKHYIKEFNSLGQTGYNSISGGYGGNKFSEEVIKKMSESAKKRWQRGISEATRQRISDGQKRRANANRLAYGCGKTPEERLKVSIANKGKKPSHTTIEAAKIANTGGKRTVDSRKKQSLSVMGEKNHFWGKHHSQKSKINNGISNVQRGLLKSNTSGYIGVSIIGRKKNMWRAIIRTPQGRLYLGSFECKEDAAKAYDKKAKEVYGDQAFTNEKLHNL